MSAVWIVSDAIVSPLGTSSEENYQRIAAGKSGIQRINNPALNQKPFHASVINNIHDTTDNSRVEQIAIQAAKHALRNVSLDPDRTIFIFSTTKGNIEFL